MKTMWLLIAVIAAVSVLHAFKTTQKSAITGTIIPLEQEQTAWAIKGKDTLKLISSGGAFIIEAKPGTYKLVIDAKEPYSDISLDNIQVANGKTTDLGEIKLMQ